MSTVAESSGANPQLAAGLAEGLSTLSLNQTVVFTLYVKLILPLDGYVFWVNSNLLNDSALYGEAQFNQLKYGNSSELGSLPKIITVQGSLHYATDIMQDQDRIASKNHVVFTTQQQIQDFNLVNPNMMYLAKFDELQFAFSKSGNFYNQAALYHYRGDAVYSVMNKQIINSMSDIDTTDVIVSNSLPMWLALNQFFPMYPAFLGEQNAALPFASVYIDPKTTQALQASPYIDLNSSHFQLVKETVKIEIFGAKNAAALEFVDYVNNYSITTDGFGVMNMPVMQDEHVTQKELGIIAMKKVISFEISYYQQNILNIAQKLITSAFITLTP